jgi:hypothetical protein
MPAARDWEDTIRAVVLATGDWEELIANHVLGAVAVAAPPQNAKQLLETLARIWADAPTSHILALVRAIPDARWRFVVQLMAAYGLRPEELQHLQIHQGRLWCMNEKVATCGKTRPRVLRPLPCDDWAYGWRLDECFPTQELPPMQPGLGGGYVGHYLMNRPLWKELRREDEAKGEKLVPVGGLNQVDQRLPGHHHLHLR